MRPYRPDPRVLPEVQAVRDAAERLRAVMVPSRLIHSAALSRVVGNDVFLKCECDNPTGSFKVRGAYNVLAQMTAGARARGVVASSAGNHGLGVAYAARTFGAPATLFLPATAPDVKKDGIRALGATVNDDAPDYDAAMVLAKRHAEDAGVPFVNPCLGLELLAGQGTVALEVLAERPDTRTVLICTGGGGLLGGMGSVFRSLAPNVAVVGVQSDQTAAMANSLAAGEVTYAPVTPTLADGLAGQIDHEALHIGQQCADRMLLVTEREIADAIAWLWTQHGLTVEGAGAVTVAALLAGKVAAPAGPMVAVVSGRNIDAAVHARLLARHAAPDDMLPPA